MKIQSVQYLPILHIRHTRRDVKSCVSTTPVWATTQQYRIRLITYTICALLCWGCETNLPPQNIPIISNITISAITDSTAICTFNVSTSDAIFSAGISYDVTDFPNLSGSITTYEFSGNTITLPIDNLQDDRVYHYKVYIRDKLGSSIDSEVMEFKTNASPYGSVFSNGITPAKSYRGGDGTINNPYLIANAQQLKKLVDDVNNNPYASLNIHFKLTTDIQVTADEWIPIGHENTSNGDNKIFAPFMGIFDGNGHTISGTLKSDKYNFFGFFGRVAGGSRISNLTIAATIRNECRSEPSDWWQNSACSFTGAICGYTQNEEIISNCHVTGTVTGGIGDICSTGGVIGYGGATIQNCHVSNNVTGGKNYDEKLGFCYSNTGGIAGTNSGEITNCTVSATITGTNTENSSYTGGIAGNNYALITNCQTTGLVMGSGKFSTTGGIVGENYWYPLWIDNDAFIISTIYNCTNNARVTGGGGGSTGSSTTGGIAGNNRSDIINCTVSATGTVTGGSSFDSNTGGIAGCNVVMDKAEGYYTIGEIIHCTNNAAITGKNAAMYNEVGGLVGKNYGVIHTSLNTGNISGGYNNGGLAGVNSYVYDLTHIYSCCTNSGTVNGQAANVNNQISDGKAVEPCPDGHPKR